MKYACIVILLVLISCRQREGKPILLRLHLQPKEQFDVEIENHVEMQNKWQHSSNTIRFVFTVDSVLQNGKTYLLSCLLKHAKASVVDRMGSGAYDSYRKQVNYNGYKEGPMKNMQQMFASVIDSSVSLHVNDRGAVQENSLVKDESILSLSGVPITYHLFQIQFPNNPVYLHEEWTNEEKVAEARFSRISNYSIQSIKDGVLQISATGKMFGLGGSAAGIPFRGEYSISEKDGKLQWANMQMTINTRMEGEGTYTVSITSH